MSFRRLRFPCCAFRPAASRLRAEELLDEHGDLEGFELATVSLGELLKKLLTLARQADLNDSAIGDPRAALDQAGLDRAVRELDRGVMADLESVCDFAEGSPFAIVLTPDGQHELVLLRSDAERSRAELAEPKEAPNGGAKGEQGFVFRLGEISGLVRVFLHVVCTTLWR